MENTQVPTTNPAQDINLKQESPTQSGNFLQKLFRLRINNKFVLLLAVVIFLALVDLRNINLPLAKIDDWQFRSEPEANGLMGIAQYVFLLISRFIDNFYLQSVFEKLLGGLLFFGFISLPFGLYLLNQRILNWFFAKVTKRPKLQLSLPLRLTLLIILFGITTIGGTIFALIKYQEFFFPVQFAGILSIALITLTSVVNIVLFPVFVLLTIINLVAKRGWQLRRRIINNFSIALSVAPIVLYALFIILINFMGAGDLNNMFTSSGGGGSYGGSTMYRSGGITSVAAPTASLGAAGGAKFFSDSALPSLGGAENLGFSVGGAKDINSFRENIENDYFPIASDITYEGLFYDYFFDTSGESTECKNLFCPAYTYAYSKDPISGEPEHYLSVGLNSNISEADFQRKKLNLVIVLDISDSMSSSFNSYYYDGNYDQDRETKSKMEVANESVVALLDHLNPDDRYGMVLFDGSAYVAKPVSRIGNTDMESIKQHILEIREQGSTNMEAGYQTGTKLLEKYVGSNKEEYENRIIFLTDAQPNTGQLDEDGLFGMTQTNAEKGIYTTFIGIGVDFNSELIEAMTKVKGANYYTVNSTDEFMSRMDEGFEYMVTPLVFDLQLNFLSDDFVIEKVYGSPEADEATGHIMNVNTLFPSKSEGGEVKGGIVLLKLKPKSGNTGVAKLVATYEDRSGQVFANNVDVNVTKTDTEFYSSTGIQKAIVLSRYVNLLKYWIEDERKAADANVPVTPRITDSTGILVPEDLPVDRELSPWERQSVQLTVSPLYGDLFDRFRDYFDLEKYVLQDTTMNKETEILDKLVQESGFVRVPIGHED